MIYSVTGGRMKGKEKNAPAELPDVSLKRTAEDKKPQPFYGPFSGTTRVSRCQKKTSGLHGERED